MKKDTIYIDIDDEITSITDKIQNAENNIVALVLPKRCTVLQSSVNMKILKKTSKQAKKKLVLITSEASLLPLAGMAGLHVAKTLQSKPEIPAAPDTEPAVSSISETDEPNIDKSKSIGELAAASEIEEPPIQLGDEPVGEDGKKKATKDKKDKKLKVPNFDKFRTRLFLAIGGGILLIIAMIFAFVVMPKAEVTVVTENKSVPVDITVTGSINTAQASVEKKIVPAKIQETDKTESKKFTATGEKNNGEKATGTMTIYNCNDNTVTLEAGTKFTNSGFTFVTTTAVEISGSNFTSTGVCKEDGYKEDVAVVAALAGDSYNLSAGRVFSSSYGSSVYGKGSAMGGGTNKIVKIVSQTDCDAAKESIMNAKTDEYKNQVAGQLTASGLTPIRDTFGYTTGAAVCSPDIGQEATEATATVKFKLSMTGIQTDSLDNIITEEVSKDLDGTQSVVDTGVESAIITLEKKLDNGDVVVRVRTDAQTGVKQDGDQIAQMIAGKKKGESANMIKSMPGVSDAQIKYSPFWVYKTPKNVEKITVNFVKNVSE